MPKSRIEELQTEIWRHTSTETAIRMPCSCGRGLTRTGRPCVYCNVDELGNLVTMPTAMAYLRTVKRIRTLEDKMGEKK